MQDDRINSTDTVKDTTPMNDDGTSSSTNENDVDRFIGCVREARTSSVSYGGTGPPWRRTIEMAKHIYEYLITRYWWEDGYHEQKKSASSSFSQPRNVAQTHQKPSGTSSRKISTHDQEETTMVQSTSLPYIHADVNLDHSTKASAKVVTLL